KGKAVASATPLERIKSGDEIPSKLHSAIRLVQRHDTDADSNSWTDNGSDIEQSYVSSTQINLKIGSDKHLILICRDIRSRILNHHPWRPIVRFGGRISN
ncbi:hypothetical protein GW17_00056853, partial [Ensete ventricosum]